MRGRGDLLDGQAHGVTLRHLVKTAAQVGQALTLDERLTFDGRPGLVKDVAQLEPARAVEIVLQAGLGEVERVG